MTEKTSTCDPHIEREGMQVYLHLSRELSFAGGHGYLNQHLSQRWKGRTYVEDQDPVRLQPVHRVCLRCQEESSPPSQKPIVTFCSEYGRKWIVGLTSAVPQRADTNSTSEACQKNKRLTEFLFPLVWRI